MNVFIHSGGQQLGPFPLEEALKKLSSGAVSASDLAWHEGMPTWAPLRQVLEANKVISTPPPPPLPAPAQPSSPGLGIVSFVIAVAGFPIWLGILILAGLFHAQGRGSQDPSVIAVGLAMFGVIGINIVGGVLGVVASINKSSSTTRSILGAIFNFLQVLGIILLIVVGLSMRK